MKVVSASVLIAGVVCLAVTVRGQSVGETVGNLPPAVAADILTILISGTVQLLGNCSDANDVSQIEYWLYTRQNPPTKLTTITPIDANKETIIVIHGWNSGRDSESIEVIRDAYLERYDCNLIVVDHSVYTSGPYQTAYCHVPAIGLAIGQDLCDLESAGKVEISDVHLVGHSLGAHISGFAGTTTKNICNKTIGRITGLDPAGPLYQGISHSQRLDASDAQFVDVIHSDQGKFGYKGNLGSVDFYPNCGSGQPGCFNAPVSSLADIVDLLVSFVSCSHSRSCYLFAESINRNGFKSTSCLTCGLPACLPQIPFLASTSYMGEGCRSNPPNPDYYLLTNGSPYYGKGPVIALS